MVLRALAELGGTLRSRFATFGAEFAIPSVAALQILETLRDAGVPVGPSRLAEEMHLTRGATTQILQTLERRGLVERAGDPDDGRLSGAVLTEAGRAALAAILPVARRREAALCGVLSPADQAELLRLLRALQHHVVSGPPP